MEWKDYTGKLNDHKSYLDMLNRLEDKTDYIEIVNRDIKPSEIVKYFQDDIISTKIVSEWWQTKTSLQCELTKIKASKELFKFLSNYETFCKYYVGKGYEPDFYEDGSGIYYDIQECTEFGCDDIAFYNSKDEILLCTTAHEGFISVNESLI